MKMELFPKNFNAPRIKIFGEHITRYALRFAVGLHGA